jgi:hypothetical protein
MPSFYFLWYPTKGGPGVSEELSKVARLLTDGKRPGGRRELEHRGPDQEGFSAWKSFFHGPYRQGAARSDRLRLTFHR